MVGAATTMKWEEEEGRETGRQQKDDDGALTIYDVVDTSGTN